MMKALLLLVCVLSIGQATTRWETWKNVNYNVTTTFTEPILSNWKKNDATNSQNWLFFSNFNDFTIRRNQYVYWKPTDLSAIVFCGPKSYLNNNM